MPTLHWIGKEKVINHHLDVPFKVLEHKYGFGEDESSVPQSDAHNVSHSPSEPTGFENEKNNNNSSGNKIIHGDNLEALKSLLPEYEAKIKCIYIDPPYNTGKENWIYNDNVNDFKIKKWLGQVVGKEAEDLTRHDKWLCMMYPRLKLLHKLLAEDGTILISIDDHEYQNLKCICDEIFGRSNFITNFTWKTEGNIDNQAKIKNNHEYILCFSKNIELFESPKVVDPNIEEGSKLFKDEIRNTIVKNGPKNPISEINLPIGFPSEIKDLIIKARTTTWPHYAKDAIFENFKLTNDVIIKSGWSSKEIFLDFIQNDFSPVKDTKEQNTIFFVSKTGAIQAIKKREEASHVVSSLQNMGSTQNMSSELNKMGFKFDYPKSLTLIQYLVSIISKKDSIVLDSFAGSGTTAHAVLNLNKQDGGNRKFILIEMEDYAETITAERVKRVIKGYGETEGTGGGFDYYQLGEPLFHEDGMLNEKVGDEKIRQYVFYTETKEPITNYGLRITDDKETKHFLGKHNDTAYYFNYEPEEITTLNHAFLATMKTRAEQYIVYADNCLLTKNFLAKHYIIFKKIPRDITRF